MYQVMFLGTTLFYLTGSFSRACAAYDSSQNILNHNIRCVPNYSPPWLSHSVLRALHHVPSPESKVGDPVVLRHRGSFCLAVETAISR